MCKGVGNTSETVLMEIKDAAYTYEGEEGRLWNGLSCRFYKGRIHAIAGASGCGKSSVLYLLNGIIPHMIEGELEGSVWFEGKDITDELPRYRCKKIGLVMQCPENQFCTFTVEEELAFGMENLCLPKEEMRGRIRETLEYVGMSGYEKYDLNHLSGGQKQKIAIASILVMEPEVLLLDEPTANLDPGSRKEIMGLITRLSRELRKTIVIVEHNLEEMKDEVDYLYTFDQNGIFHTDSSWEDIPGNKYLDLLRKGNRQKTAGQEPKKPEILEISDVWFAYPEEVKKHAPERKWILNGLSFSLRQNDFLAIAGDNGAGKSTLLQVVFQIFKQDKGVIKLHGKPIEQYKKRDLYRQLGLVFQNPENQFVTNTVTEELMFSLRKEPISRAEKEEKVLRVLRQFHLENDKEKSPFVLSQGQKRRLSVATMLLTDQKILFLDEPTYGQDFENRHELMRDMQSLNKAGTTIVMITHDLSLVEEYASRVVEIKSGKVISDSTAWEFAEKKREKREESDVCISGA